MKDLMARIESIEIENFKNVKYGMINFKNSRNKSSILGLYGQNGSGKTALIDALELLKLSLSWQPIPDYYADFVNVDAEYSKLKYNIKITSDEVAYNVYYEFCIRRENTALNQNISEIKNSDKNYRALIFDEVLSYSYTTETKKTKMLPIIDTRTEDVFVPKSKYKELVGASQKTKAELIACKEFSFITSRSFIFSGNFANIIRANCKNEYHLNVYEKLIWFGHYELFVIKTSNTGLITLNGLPLSFKYENDGEMAIGNIIISLNETTLIPEETLHIVKNIIQKMNIVLNQIVPGLNIGVKEFGKDMFSNGKPGYNIQLVSYKNSKEIPLRYESEGIKKIISILQLLIVVYNKESITVAVDELDSGVFEYLLGELLRIIAQKGKGQLIFTSHNLRPLETLERGFIAFTTTNPQKRYIRLSNIKTNNNLRDFYYRDIMLGEQNEPLYDAANNYEIAFAFREAGEENGS